MAILVFWTGADSSSMRDRLWHHRNLGKAYYENPMTQVQAVEEFKQALQLDPNSPRDRVNYGLALLRAGSTKEAIAELLQAQKQDPSIPHTWFNLGIAYKDSQDYPRAIQQLEGMLKLVPNEPAAHYNLGIAYRLINQPEQALPHFVAAAGLNPNFAAPHFQLYNAYRDAGRKDDAARELEQFNEIKKRKAGAAVQEDPEWSYYSEIYDVVDLDEELDSARSSIPLNFLPQQVASGVDTATAGLAVLDFDGDGKPDLIVWSEKGVIVLKNGVTRVPDTGLESLAGVVSISPGDFNNDGLPDLAVVTHAGVVLYVNDGGKFKASPIKMPSGVFRKAIWVDYDHDYDLDLVLLGDKPLLLRNEGDLGFSDQTAQFPFVAGQAVDGAVFDLVADSNEADLAVLYGDGSTVIYRDELRGHYRVEATLHGAGPGISLQAIDINNDGWTDLILTTGSGARLLVNDHGKLKEVIGKIAGNGPMAIADIANRSLSDLVGAGWVYRNLGSTRFEPAKVEPLADCLTLVAADFDGDGHVDLAGVTANGSVYLFKNATVTTNSFISVRLEGVKNLKQANGALIEVKAGAWYQKRTYRGVPLVFGLRGYGEVDTIRITWPNGLVQNETRQPVGQQLAYKEKARLSGSCPMIFAWNGSRFEFVSDVLGVAPLGASNGEGKYFPVNHQEYVRIPDSAVRPSRGRYEIRITEELREISYLDQVRLVAVDHPANEELFTSDKFTGPPFPRHRFYGVQRRTYPIRAEDEKGRDVLERLLRSDGRYVDTFTCDVAGVAEPHSLLLDFGNADPGNRAILVLRGWVNWADGSTFLSAAQRGKMLTFPYLQVEDSSGHWRTVIEDMGMPSGKPKSIVVDLTGKFLSGSRKVRIVTDLCVYWDEAFLSENTAAPAVATASMAPDLAELQYRGFSWMSPGATPAQPAEFDYARWSAQSMWNPTPGRYTRYGDVRRLLLRPDDEFVVMGSGDELRLMFDLRRLARLPRGRTRSYFLFVDGWAKDGDSNTAYSTSVDPLPFHAMTSYPYPSWQHYPDDLEHRRYTTIYNTRPPFYDLDSLREPVGQRRSLRGTPSNVQSSAN